MRLFLTFLLSLLIYLSSVISASASTFSLGVFPPILEIIAKPGAEVRAKLRIINYGDSASLRVYPQLFKVADEMGNIEPIGIREEKEIEEVLGWVSLESASEIFPGEINLGTNETRDFSLILKIPKNAKEDDHYFTVFFELIPFAQISETHAKAAARVGANVLLTVSERTIIPKYGEIVEFSAPKFVESGPVKFTLRVKNNGRTFFKPIGEIRIYNTLMRQTGEIAILPQNILAGTTRALQDKSILAQMKEQKVLGAKKEVSSIKHKVLSIKYISKFLNLLFIPHTEYSLNTSTPTLLFPRTFLLGRYTAVASFTLDEKGPTLTAKTTFYAFPIRIALAVIIVVSLLSGIKKRLKS